LQVNIKDTSILDKIKIVFKSSLDTFKGDINSASSSFEQVINNSNTKISQIRSIINKLESEISYCIGKLSNLNSELASYRASASSARASASSAEDSSSRNHYLSIARDYDYKASQTQHEISLVESQLQTLKIKKSKEEAREAKAKNVLALAKREFDKYNNLKAEVNANANNIFDSASKKIQSIKSSVNEYVDVQSNISSASPSKSENRSSKSSFSNENSDNAIDIDDYELDIGGDLYKIKPQKAGKRFKCNIEKNSNMTESKFNFKASSKSIELLSLSSNIDTIHMQIIDSFLLKQAQEHEVKTINTWADSDEIELFKSVGYEIKTAQKDGSEMYKNV
jgi:hypothetical protein